jgi:hypothetical protein
VVSAAGAGRDTGGGGGACRSGSLALGGGTFGIGGAPGLSVSFQSAIRVGSIRLKRGVRVYQHRVPCEAFDAASLDVDANL